MSAEVRAMLRKAEFGPVVNDYPTSDGRPLAETDHHRLLMTDLIETLTDHFADKPNVYVSGNLLLFYEEGNKRRHVSPDVMVVFGVPKYPRLNYRVWIEGKVPSVVIELTSATTRREDQKKKLMLYRDVLKVPEYFLFDPFGDYLEPRFQGYRLVDGNYIPIRVKDERMKCRKLGLELVQEGHDLRLFDPATGERLLTRSERAAAAEAKAYEAEVARRAADEARRTAESAKKYADDEIERLNREIEELRRNPGKNS